MKASGSRSRGRRGGAVVFEASPVLKVKAVPHELFVAGLAERLKRDYVEVKPPVYAPFVKTASTNFEPPKRVDWWYVRAASVLRKLAVKGCMGVTDLAYEYSGKRRRGRSRERFVLGSRGHVRRVLIQLEGAKLVEKQRCGRVLSKAGWELVLGVASEVLDSVSKVEPRLRLYVG
ncbi:MAG: 40S ribosomal protein S19 [Thermoprotei archaeon]